MSDMTNPTDWASADFSDDNLDIFARDGAPPFPAADSQGHVDHDGARIWYASISTGSPVILLHGGLGNAGNWGHQIQPLLAPVLRCRENAAAFSVRSAL